MFYKIKTRLGQYSDEFFKKVELEGIKPSSKLQIEQASTCLLLFFLCMTRYNTNFISRSRHIYRPPMLYIHPKVVLFYQFIF